MEVPLILLLFGAPIVLIMGWIRWFGREWYGVQVSETSMIGLALATAAVTLVLLLFLFAYLGVGRFRDLLFIAICRAGFFFSLAAILCCMARTRGRNPLQWHTLACSISTLLFWFMLFGVQSLGVPMLSSYFGRSYHG